jgi:hypothetical protein
MAVPSLTNESDIATLEQAMSLCVYAIADIQGQAWPAEAGMIASSLGTLSARISNAHLHTNEEPTSLSADIEQAMTSDGLTGEHAEDVNDLRNYVLGYATRALSTKV